MAIGKHARRIRRRPGQPIDCVLKYARNGIVVLGGYQQEGIRRDDLLLELDHCRGNALLLHVPVIERNAADRGRLDRRAGGRKLHRRAQQPRIEGRAPQAACNSEYFRHYKRHPRQERHGLRDASRATMHEGAKVCAIGARPSNYAFSALKWESNMWRAAWVAGTLVLTSAVCAAEEAQPTSGFALTSPDIAQGRKIASAQIFNSFGCAGENVSPAL